MGAIKVFLKEVLLPTALAFCLASFLKPIYMPDGVCDYFLMWICVGLPFGIRRMCLWLVPSGYGISGSVGIFALNLIIPCWGKVEQNYPAVKSSGYPLREQL